MMICEDDSRLSATEFSGKFDGKLTLLLTETDDESDMPPEYGIEEEKVEEIMQELYKEITCSASTSTSPHVSLPSPLASPSLLQSSSSSLPTPFVASSEIQSESCGASVSDSASTVMVGIEFVGTAGKISGGKVRSPEMDGWWVLESGCKCGVTADGLEADGVGVEVEVEEITMDGCDGDDQWLARILRCGPVDLEEWT